MSPRVEKSKDAMRAQSLQNGSENVGEHVDAKFFAGGINNNAIKRDGTAVGCSKSVMNRD